MKDCRAREREREKMCVNETQSKVRTGKRLSDVFPLQNGLKQALWPLLFNFAVEDAVRKVQNKRGS
jgi:hypothetical protein